MARRIDWELRSTPWPIFRTAVAIIHLNRQQIPSMSRLALSRSSLPRRVEQTIAILLLAHRSCSEQVAGGPLLQLHRPFAARQIRIGTVLTAREASTGGGAVLQQQLRLRMSSWSGWAYSNVNYSDTSSELDPSRINTRPAREPPSAAPGPTPWLTGIGHVVLRRRTADNRNSRRNASPVRDVHQHDLCGGLDAQWRPVREAVRTQRLVPAHDYRRGRLQQGRGIGSPLLGATTARSSTRGNRSISVPCRRQRSSSST